MSVILDKLLKGQKVEWKTIDEIANFRRGSFPQPYGNKEWYDGEESMPFVQVVDIDKNMKLVHTTKQKISKLAQSKSVFVPKNTVIVSLQGSIGRVAVTQYDCYADRTIGIFQSYKDKINVKYFAYQLERIFSIKGKFARGTTLKTITKEEFSNFELAIPSLEAQAKIVKILDAFTAVTAELTAELTMREKQYHYYRDNLLTFSDDEVEWKSISEVFNVIAGGDAPKNAFSNVKTDEFRIPILSNGIDEKALYGWTNIAKVSEPSLTISARGTIGWTSYQETPIYPIVRLIVLTPKINLNLKYAYYFMKTIENSYKVSKAGIPQLTKPMVNDIKFPIPSLNEQKRIVAILDKLDTLANSITEGLPKEIALRQQQYEYYREQLLDFPK